MRSDFVIMPQVKRSLQKKSTSLHLASSNLDCMETVADRIRRLRKKLALTQAQFGALAGCSKSAVSQWERGETEPERNSLDALRYRKHVNPDWITRGEGGMFLSDPAALAPPGSPEPQEPTLTALLDTLAARIAEADPAVRAEVTSLVLRYMEKPESGAKIAAAIELLISRDPEDDSTAR